MNITDLAVRILNAAADELDRAALIHPITGVREARCMTDGRRDVVVRGIKGDIARVYGEAARSALSATVLPSLPPAGCTDIEYAERLRAAA